MSGGYYIIIVAQIQLVVFLYAMSLHFIYQLMIVEYVTLPL